MKASTNRDAAFTLVEVLVASAIAAITIATGAFALGQAFRAFSSVAGLSRKIEGDTARLEAFERLRSDLASAIPPPENGPPSTATFAGDRAGFSCLRLASANRTEAGYRLFRVTWEGDGAGGCIRRAEPVAQPPAPPGSSGDCAPLLRFPARWGPLSFEWTAATPAAAGAAPWRDDWIENALPAAASVRWGELESIFAIRSATPPEGAAP